MLLLLLVGIIVHHPHESQLFEHILSRCHNLAVIIIVAYVAAAECFGFPLIYLEAGSGASSPVPPTMISAAKKVAPNAMIVVGGGMHNGELAQQSVRAGADWIVTGNLTEEFDDAGELENVMRDYIQTMRSH